MFGTVIGGYLEIANVAVQEAIANNYTNDGLSPPDIGFLEDCPMGAGSALFQGLLNQWPPKP